MHKGWLFALFLTLASSAVMAVDVAPRISDREIIEALTELKAGQKALEAKMDQHFEAVNQRFEAVNQRFAAVDQRFEAVDQRFESMEAGFNQRFNFLENLLMVVIAGIFGLIGYIVWDRKTALRPVEERLLKLENELHRDLEIQHEEGSRLTRLVKVLREMAKHDEKLASVLRNFSLL
jgi:DNA repair exonuclease SbcCD ATPase subunit